MNCPQCNYANDSQALVCGLCGQLLARSTSIARPVAVGAAASGGPVASPRTAAPIGRIARPRGPSSVPSGLAQRRTSESLTAGGWALVALGVLGLAFGLLIHAVGDAIGADGPPIVQYAGSALLLALGVASVCGSRLSFRIGFWIYALDSAAFVVLVVLSGAALMAGGIVVRIGVLVWLSNQYRSI